MKSMPSPLMPNSSFHSKIFLGLLLFLLLLGSILSAQAGTITSAQTGNWNSPSTWVGGVVPVATDSVIIAAGHTVTVNGPTSIVNLTINSTGVLANGGFALTVTGNLTVNGTLSGTGSTTLNGVSKTIDGTGAVTSTGTLTISTGGKTIPLTASLTFSGTIAITGAITVTNSGTITTLAAGGITGSVAGSTWANAAGSTLNIAGPLLATGSLTANPSGNTVNYNGAGAQTIKPATYRQLILSNAGTKTAGGALTVNGNFTISGTATFNGGTSLTHTFLGNWVVNTTAVTPFTFTTASTINLNTPANLSSSTLGGSSTSTIGFNNLNINNTGGINANLNLSASGNLVIGAGASLTPAAAVIISGTGALTGSGTVRVTRTAATADFLSQYTITNKTLTNLTVDYNGSNQVLSNLTYGSGGLGGLTISGSITGVSNTAVVGGVFNVTGTLMPAGGTITMNSGSSITNSGTLSFIDLTIAASAAVTTATSFTIVGSLTVNSGASFNASAGTITFSGSPASTIGGANFNNLVVNKTSATAALAGNVNIAGDLTVSGGTFDLTGNTANRSPAGGTFLLASGSTLLVGGSTGGVSGSNFPNNFTTRTLNGTVHFNGTGAQTIPAFNYSNLTVSGTRTTNNVTLESSGIIGVAGTFTSTSTFTSGAYVTTGSHVMFNGASAQSTSPFSYNNLSINKAGGSLTLLGPVNVGGILTFTNGNIVTDTHMVSITPTGSVSRTSGHVVGNLEKYVSTGAAARTFEIGDASTFTPVDLAFNNVTIAGYVTAKTTAGDHPGIASSIINSAKSVNRYWTITNGGITFDTVRTTFNFAAGDVDAGASTANFIIGKYDAPSWSTTAVGGRAATSTEATGVTSFSDFQVGEAAPRTITASSGPGGSISPNGAVNVIYGSDQSFTISPNTGRHVDSLIVDGVNQGQLTSYTFTNVTVDHAIRAVFAINQYTITASAGLHGNINPNGAVVVNWGANRTFTMNPGAAYHVDSVIVDGIDQGPLPTYTFTNVTSDHTIRVVFAINQYTITATAGPNGSISPSGAVLINQGANRVFTVTPDTGYHVDSLVVDGTNQGPLTSYTFTNVVADHAIDAFFSINEYTITATAQAHGTISPIGAVIVTYGASQSFIVLPDTGYHVDSLVVDGIDQGPLTTYTFTNVTFNQRIRASFAINQYTIVSSASANGSISPSGTLIVNYGVNRQFTVTPDTGYHVDSLIVDGTDLGQRTSHTFTNITADHTIRAVFAIDQFTITASAQAHGSIDPGGVVNVNYGADQSFTVTPDTGYYVDSLFVDGIDQGQLTSYTFTNVTANHRIRASFAINQYTITASAGAHGSISPSGAVIVDYGANQLFDVTPDTGYHVDSLIVDGTNQGQLRSYKFTNIIADHTIRAVFAPIQSSITVITAIDMNGNGIQDSADVAPLPAGITAKILLLRNGAPYDSTIVGDGLVSIFTFFISTAGNYKVREEGLPAGWIRTAGGLDSALVAASDVQDTATFLNFKLVSVRGTAFNDRNKNGLYDFGELGLHGWVIQASGSGGRSRTTDVIGDYELKGLGPGTHTITETMVSNWAQTLPPAGSYTFEAVSGQDQSGFDFGNYDTRIVNNTITGIVFADVAMDSMKNPPDFGLRNWKILLHPASAPSLVDTARTDSLGFYFFNHLAPGNYVVSEVRRPRFAQTYPPSGSYSVTVDSLGTPVVDRDFGNYRLVTSDTARAVVINEVIAVRPDTSVLKAFQFHVPGSAQLPMAASVAASAGDSLPEGTVVYSWDSSVVYNVTRPQFFYWIDLQGGLKFGHRTLFLFVDQAAQAETVSAQWWPVISLPDQNPMEVWNSWDDRVTSPDLFYGGYGPGNVPLAQRRSSISKQEVPASVSSTTVLTGTAALLVGGKAESSTEQATWQHDLDSVRASLIYGNPPALDSNNVLLVNDATGDALNALLQQVANCDTLYFFFTGHGDSSEGGAVVLNHVGGPVARELLTYAGLSNALFNTMNLKRLNMLVDASNSGKAIDDFMQTRKPVVNLVTSTDAVSAAGAGLPNDTVSTYTKIWRQTTRTVPITPAVRLNWRTLNATIRANNPTITSAQNPADTTNAPLFVASSTSIVFSDVAVGDSNARGIDVSNLGFIPLDVDSIQISDPDFFIAAPHTGTIVRNGVLTFPVIFKPTSDGSKFATITFYHNGEISTANIPASGRGVLNFDTLKYRTFSQADLALKGIKKKPYATKFCATFYNNSSSPVNGIIVKFNLAVSITFADRFPNPPASGDAGRGKIWIFTGSTIPLGAPLTICGVGNKGKPVRVDYYFWTSNNTFDPKARLQLSPPTPPGQQLLLPMPTAGNLRDTVFRISDYFTNGFVIGVPLSPPLDLQHGWIRITKSSNLVKFFSERGATQSGDARPFDIVGIKSFIKEQKNLSAKKYSNHLAGELAALHFSIRASALTRTPIGLGELIYDDSTANPLNGLMIRTIADSADRMLTYRWGPTSLYRQFDSVISRINRAFSGPIDTVSFGSVLRLKGVCAPDAIQYIRASTIPPTRIEPLDQGPDIPEGFTLYQNYPNPFNPTTTIEFELPEPAIVTLRIYNVLGQEIATLLDHQALEDGNQEAEFSAQGLPSGVYFYRLVVNTIPDDEETPTLTHVSVKKMLLLK